MATTGEILAQFCPCCTERHRYTFARPLCTEEITVLSSTALRHVASPFRSLLSTPSVLETEDTPSACSAKYAPERAFDGFVKASGGPAVMPEVVAFDVYGIPWVAVQYTLDRV